MSLKVKTDIESNLSQVNKRVAGACQRAGRLPEEITMIAVTKTVAPAAVAAAWKLGKTGFRRR